MTMRGRRLLPALFCFMCIALTFQVYFHFHHHGCVSDDLHFDGCSLQESHHRDICLCFMNSFFPPCFFSPQSPSPIVTPALAPSLRRPLKPGELEIFHPPQLRLS